MTHGPALNLNLATRPRRNRRLYLAAVRTLAAVFLILAGLAAFVALKDGRALARLKKEVAETERAQTAAGREAQRLKTDIDRESKLSGPRIDLVNGLIQRKMFSWTGLFTDLEKCLPGPSYITSLSPSFTAEGAVALQMRVTSRSLNDLLAFINALYANGFSKITEGGEIRDEGGRILSEMTAIYERPL
jgi:Tfp pilus assembly protein PilN